MELIDEIQRLAKIYNDRKDMIVTEEATKNALIMPFISALGYNVFDPSEVVPEFTADVGSKKGEKVDYAIHKDGKPIMLVEAKWCGEKLDVTKESQLLRYFHTTTAAIGILTNGCEYRFYTDLDQENVMDQKPFLQFSIFEINEQIIRELKKFAKTAFNLDEIVSTASELKYTGEMKRFLSEQLAEPGNDFVEYMTKQVFQGRFTEKVREKFKGIVKKAFTQFVSERVSDRLSLALSEEKAAATQELHDELMVEDDSKNMIVTSQEEIDAYNIVKAILCQKVDAKRVVMRDCQAFCNILLDDTNRKPLCRFYFNLPDKSLSLFDNDKKGCKVPITNLDDIYNHKEALIKTLENYLQGKAGENLVGNES